MELANHGRERECKKASCTKTRKIYCEHKVETRRRRRRRVRDSLFRGRRRHDAVQKVARRERPPAVCV